jgi:hypothetical protein
MDCVYLPIIAEDDFKAFRDVLRGELPPTYSEWLQREANRVAHWRDTHEIIRVNVKASDFTAYLRAGGHGHDLNRLYIFAESVWKRSGD